MAYRLLPRSCGLLKAPRTTRVLTSRCARSISQQAPRWLVQPSNATGSNSREASDVLVPKDLDAIVILAGGQNEHRESGLPVWVERRLDACADILQLQSKAECVILCSGGGTPHKPPVMSDTGYCVFESMACASFLEQQAVPGSRILRETASYDTIGNGYFAATIHALPCAWRSVAVVTSDFHMPRSRAIFEKVFELASLRAPPRVDLSFFAVSDEGVFAPDVLSARHSREATSRAAFDKDMASIHSLAHFHHWLHMTHRCYAVPRQGELGTSTNVDDVALASY